MFLYNLSLHRPTAIVMAAHGNFSGGRQQEIAVCRGRFIELLKIHPTTGRLLSLVVADCFANVRAIHPFRLVGGTKDYLVVASDSGRIAVLEYDPKKNLFDRVHLETFGRSGCRRVVPGQYLAMDPKGRAVMICALEKAKFVYIFNRDSQARLTISSPLEAHRSNTLLFHVVGLDVGFDNPIFACLEIDYEEVDQDTTGESARSVKQSLTYYELDLGLNHVVRKFSEPLDVKANMLIPVPGGSDGPSGLLLCGENFLVYKNLGDQPDIKIPIPRRRNDLDDPERGMMFICSSSHKTKTMFFFLLQTEQGDVFKVTLVIDEDMVREMRLKYFDTLPVATSMCVLKTGFLFVAAEFGNHYLYQIAHLGDDDTEPEFSSSLALEEGETFFYAPRPLKNLVLVDEVDSLSPILNCQLSENASLGGAAGEELLHLYALVGRSARSSLKVLRHGLEVTEMAVSELPGNPSAVWTVRRTASAEFDAYIIVSFVNATLVLSVGETVEEVTDSGFLGTAPTLAAAQIGDDALIQVYPDGIRHIRADRRVNEWRTPGRRQIVRCAVNQRQVVIALGGGELVYFEMDPTGQLNEYTERRQMQRDVVCMALGRVPTGEQRFPFLAVGLSDQTVRIVSLDQNDCLTPLSTQALPAAPEMVAIAEMGPTDDSRETAGGLYLFTGLTNGVLLRTRLDRVSGNLSDTRTRYLGTRPVRLFGIAIQAGAPAMLAVSSRPTLCYWYASRFHVSPLCYEAIDYASGFTSEQCPEGIVCIAANTLRILALEKLGGAVFNQISHPLPMTPRRFVVHPSSGNLVIICTDHQAFTEPVRKQRKQQMAREMVDAAAEADQAMASELAAQFLAEQLPDDVFSPPRAGSGMWASCVLLVNPVTGQIIDRHDFEQNEAAQSIALIRFPPAVGIGGMDMGGGDAFCAVVGTVRDFVLNPRNTGSGSFLHTFRLADGGQRFELLHVTPVEDIPGVLASFQGRLLAGVGSVLRLYELGRKKLLRKAECRRLPNMIVSLQTSGLRIVAGDVQESLHWLSYRRTDNQLVLFADDTMPRWITTASLLDHDTVAGADKFGNVFVLRLPAGVNDSPEDDPSGARALWDRGCLNGAWQKADAVAHFYVGDIITSFQRATLVAGGVESLLYTTLGGSIGMLVPFASKEDHDFFKHLELHLRQEMPPYVGRDHLSYRSYYAPVRNVIDGDLCEVYAQLDSAKQRSIAEELEKRPSEIAKKLEDMRTRYGF